MSKTAEERLAELQEKRKREEERLARIKNQEKDLMKRMKAEDRKARTHRLIVCGAAIESALGRAIDIESGEEEVIAALIASSLKSGIVEKDAFAAVISEILDRELIGSDIHKIKTFLQYQEDRGKYFSRWMQKE